jgi:hypothetical protein
MGLSAATLLDPLLPRDSMSETSSLLANAGELAEHTRSSLLLSILLLEFERAAGDIINTLQAPELVSCCGFLRRAV